MATFTRFFGCFVLAIAGLSFANPADADAAIRRRVVVRHGNHLHVTRSVYGRTVWPRTYRTVTRSYIVPPIVTTPVFAPSVPLYGPVWPTTRVWTPGGVYYRVTPF